MKNPNKVASELTRPAYIKEYQALLRQWMNNAAAMSQDETDPQFRHYLRAWYACFETAYEVITRGGEVQIRVYSTPTLPDFNNEEDYAAFD